MVADVTRQYLDAGRHPTAHDVRELDAAGWWMLVIGWCLLMLIAALIR